MTSGFKLKPGRAYSLMALWIAGLLACSSGKNEPLRIACAANAHFAIADVASLFTEQTGIRTEVIPGSSGNLTAQISQGAPYDIFISADTHYPQTLKAGGRVDGEVRLYSLGQLVLWTNSTEDYLHIDSLLSDNLPKIAIANPNFAPYGIAALEALNTLGIYEQIKDKLVYGESITQVNQFVFSGAAQIGFTSKSTVMSPDFTGRGHWTDVDSTLYRPIEQACVVVNRSGAHAEASRFVEYLLGPDGRRVLRRFGYGLPGESK